MDKSTTDIKSYKPKHRLRKDYKIDQEDYNDDNQDDIEIYLDNSLEAPESITIY